MIGIGPRFLPVLPDAVAIEGKRNKGYVWERTETARKVRGSHIVRVHVVRGFLGKRFFSIVEDLSSIHIATCSCHSGTQDLRLRWNRAWNESRLLGVILGERFACLLGFDHFALVSLVSLLNLGSDRVEQLILIIPPPSHSTWKANSRYFLQTLPKIFLFRCEGLSCESERKIEQSLFMPP